MNTLTLVGASYGTFVAEHYAISHPDRVARLVLDSVVPHDTFDPLEIAALNRTAHVLQMVCAETRCGTDPVQDLSDVIRIRHDGPQSRYPQWADRWRTKADRHTSRAARGGGG